MLISLYSLLLAGSLVVTAPWWLYRMLTSNRYRAGLLERLGRVPPALRAAAHGKPVIWLHAVSVGELLAAQRLITELQSTFPTHLIALSTTTATAHKLARERFKLAADSSQAHSSSDIALFYFPLDFRFAIRTWLHALQPRLVILMESELWPRLLHESAAARIPVAVANARVSDRSFRRTYRFRSLWLRMARHVTLFLAQSQETATRLEAFGIPPTRIQTPGNLKYDLPEPAPRPILADITRITNGNRLIIAGSTLPGEEAVLVASWGQLRATQPDLSLVIAPRHPGRAPEIERLLSSLPGDPQIAIASEPAFADGEFDGSGLIILDTLGDLASVYSLATVAFIGGSLVPRGGHNPLEAARFGIPILMGASYENFREIVEGMIAAHAIHITTSETLAQDLTTVLQDHHGLGQRAQTFFRYQSGATARTLAALLHQSEEPHP